MYEVTDLLQMVLWIFLSTPLMKAFTQDISFDKPKEIRLQSVKKNPSQKQINAIQIGLSVVLFAFL